MVTVSNGMVTQRNRSMIPIRNLNAPTLPPMENRNPPMGTPHVPETLTTNRTRMFKATLTMNQTQTLNPHSPAQLLTDPRDLPNRERDPRFQHTGYTVGSPGDLPMSDSKSPEETVHAQPPQTLCSPKRTDRAKSAGGWGALNATMRHGFSEMGFGRTVQTLLKVNQEDGFDCPGCAWPEPQHRSSFEFCENGAKAVVEEANASAYPALSKHIPSPSCPLGRIINWDVPVG